MRFVCFHLLQPATTASLPIHHRAALGACPGLGRPTRCPFHPCLPYTRSTNCNRVTDILAMQWEVVEQSLARRAWQMSSNDWPSAARQETENPALGEADISIPGTRTVSNENHVSPGTGSHIARNPPQHVLESIGADASAEYGHSSRNTGQSHSGASEAAAGAWNGEELLRRLSLTGQSSRIDAELIDPRNAHPSLGLSGNVISASFCVPYKVGYTTTGEWVGWTVE